MTEKNNQRVLACVDSHDNLRTILVRKLEVGNPMIALVGFWPVINLIN